MTKDEEEEGYVTLVLYLDLFAPCDRQTEIEKVRRDM